MAKFIDRPIYMDEFNSKKTNEMLDNRSAFVIEEKTKPNKKQVMVLGFARLHQSGGRERALNFRISVNDQTHTY